MGGGPPVRNFRFFFCLSLFRRKRCRMFWNGKKIYQKHLIKNLCFRPFWVFWYRKSENVKKKQFLGGVRKNTVFAVRGGGGSESYEYIRFFLTPSLTDPFYKLYTSFLISTLGFLNSLPLLIKNFIMQWKSLIKMSGHCVHNFDFLL